MTIDNETKKLCSQKMSKKYINVLEYLKKPKTFLNKGT